MGRHHVNARFRAKNLGMTGAAIRLDRAMRSGLGPRVWLDGLP